MLVVPPFISCRRFFRRLLRGLFGFALPACVLPTGLPVFPAVTVTVLVIGDSPGPPDIPAIGTLLLGRIVHVRPAVAAWGLVGLGRV